MTTTHTPDARCCSLCGSIQSMLSVCAGGYICEACAENHRAGRNNTTRDAKAQASGQRATAGIIRAAERGEPIEPKQAYRAAATEWIGDGSDAPLSPAIIGAGGEVAPAHEPEVFDTMANPSAVALDASAQRVELLGQLGVDAVALGLDAAASIGAQNSLEKMLAHQLAALHSAFFDCLTKSAMAQNPNDAMRYMNMATKIANATQGGMLTLKRMRSSGQQSITVQHVTVKDGGQAVIGEVRARGGQSK